MNTTRNIAGCQALRRRMGHCLFGMRVVEGECVFLTFSPNRRQSSMIFKMSRTWATDTALKRPADAARFRAKCSSADAPKIFTEKYVADYEDLDVKDEEVQFELPLPPLSTRQACNAEDPLSSVHHYLYCAKVMLPAALGMRMCMNCPHCNCDENDPNIVVQREHRPCQNVFGHNPTIMGGYAGIAHSLSSRIEFQGNGTPHVHAHALISLGQYVSIRRSCETRSNTGPSVPKPWPRQSGTVALHARR